VQPIQMIMMRVRESHDIEPLDSATTNMLRRLPPRCPVPIGTH
jgi:hypothetical protein